MAKAVKQNIAGQEIAPNSPVRTILLLVVFIIPCVIMMPVAIVIVIGMMPTFGAWMVESRPEKNASISVAIMNFCGVLPHVMNLWSSGISLQNAMYILRDPFNLFMMYGAASTGWVLILCMPPVMLLMNSIKNEEIMRKLRARQQNLYEEWGETLKDATVEVSPKSVEQYQI